MNFLLSNIPDRTIQPRSHGLTVVSDKGLSLSEASYLVSAAGPHIDVIKLAFGTPLVTPLLAEKIKFYHSHNIPVFFGGLLFEAYVIRGQLNEYVRLVEENDIKCVEISDGAIDISHDQKCNYIREFSRRARVFSEVGSKDKDKVKVTPPYKWIELMDAELNAGSTYLIAEAKEMGDVGVYRNSGEVREGLVEEISTKIPAERIIWEAPAKDQQLYFIKLFGCNVNLGNINASEVIGLEAMRLGLRSDSFTFFLKN